MERHSPSPMMKNAPCLTERKISLIKLIKIDRESYAFRQIGAYNKKTDTFTSSKSYKRKVK